MADHFLQWLDSTAGSGGAERSFGTQLLREVAVSFSRDESLLTRSGANDTTAHAIETARLTSAALASAISDDAKKLALASALSAIRALNIMSPLQFKSAFLSRLTRLHALHVLHASAFRSLASTIETQTILVTRRPRSADLLWPAFSSGQQGVAW